MGKYYRRKGIKYSNLFINGLIVKVVYDYPMGFIEVIERNFVSSLLFWGVCLASIGISYLYQKKRLAYLHSVDIVKCKSGSVPQHFWTFGMVIAPALFIGLRRYDVGYDTINYVTSYLNYGSNPFLSEEIRTFSGGPLFVILRHLIYLVSGGNPTFFLFLMAFTTLYILVRTLDRWIAHISIPFALFIYYAFFGMQLMNQSRQMLALSLVLYGLSFVISRKYLRYSLMILVASMLHYTALFGLIFIFINFKLTKSYVIKKWFYILLLVSSPILIYPALTLFSKIVENSYSVYLEGISISSLGFGLILNIAPVIIPPIIFRRFLRGEVNSLLFRMAMLTFPLRLAGYYSYFVMRMYYYGAIAIVLIIPLIVNGVVSKSNKRILVLVFVLVYLIYYVVNYMYVNATNMFPYNTIFQ